MTPSKKHIVLQKKTGPRQSRRHLTDDEAEQNRDMRCGLLLSIVLYSRAPKQYKLFPAIVSSMLWIEGVSQAVTRFLNFLGISQGVEAGRSNIDRLRQGYDHLVYLWKDEIEKQLTPVPLPNVTQTQPTRAARRSLEFGHSPMSPAHTGTPSLRPAGYGLTFDNVQFASHAKHQMSASKSDFHIMALAFADKHRVTFDDYEDTTATGRATDLDPGVFLPGLDDFAAERHAIQVMVERVLVVHLTFLNSLKKSVVWHIPHEYSAETAQKSEIVNLGVYEGNPSTSPDTISILDSLSKYIPVIDGEPLSVIVNGDAGTIDTVIKAKKGRAWSTTPIATFKSMIESPQEFHKEGLLLQDLINELFSASSERSRGTLFQVKQQYDHKSASTDVMNTFQHVTDLVDFSTDGNLLLLAMDLLGTSDLGEVPVGFPDTKDDQMQWLHSLSAQLVDKVLSPAPTEEIRIAAMGYRSSSAKPAKQKQPKEQDVFPFCCEQATGEDMVRCCSAACEKQWVHFSCATPVLNEPPSDDWFCSSQCESHLAYVYCLCQKKEDGEMVQCHKKEECQRYEWYHISCLGLNKSELPEEWYCSPQCLESQTDADAKMNYHLRLLELGMKRRVRVDAVREGDGIRMLQMWKIDLLDFHNKNHPRYLRLAHRLLAYTGGFLPRQLGLALTWNRVANLQGQKACNLGLDLINEHLNNDFKEIVKRSHGRYTPEQLQRCSQMAGTYKKEMRRLVQATVSGAELHRIGGHQTPKYYRDIPNFVRRYKKEKLFSYHPGRNHRGYEKFTRNSRFKSPYKLGSELKRLSGGLDMWREIGKGETRPVA